MHTQSHLFPIGCFQGQHLSYSDTATESKVWWAVCPSSFSSSSEVNNRLRRGTESVIYSRIVKVLTQPKKFTPAKLFILFINEFIKSLDPPCDKVFYFALNSTQLISTDSDVACWIIGWNKLGIGDMKISITLFFCFWKGMILYYGITLSDSNQFVLRWFDTLNDRLVCSLVSMHLAWRQLLPGWLCFSFHKIRLLIYHSDDCIAQSMSWHTTIPVMTKTLVFSSPRRQSPPHLY